MLFFVLGALRLNSSFQPNEYANFFDQKTAFEGFVSEDPDVREDKQFITFQPENFTQKVLLTLPLGQEFFYGDRIFVEGKIQEAKNFSEFDYKGYLERYEVYAVSQRPKVLILKSNQQNPVKYYLLKIKHKFSQRTGKFLPEPHNSLLLGILIGAKKGLPKNIIEHFNISGLTHILAASGFNISIIVMAVGESARLIGRKKSFWLSILAVFAFGVIAGMSASVVRALVMGGILLFAFRFGRLYRVGGSLVLAAFLMLLLNPKILVWDVGFQLSFAATLGIVYGMKIFQGFNLENEFELISSIKTLLLASLCAIVATLPLSLLHFGQASPYALLANLLVLPLVPYLMLIGFLSVLPVVAPALGFLAFLGTSYMLFVVSFIDRLPGSSLQFSIPWWVAAGVYIVMISGYLSWHQQRKKAVAKALKLC